VITVRHDAKNDVLYVRREASYIAYSRESPADGCLIQNLDLSGGVVGIQLIMASDTNALGWAAHPDRDLLPIDVFEAVSDWILAQK
jgi:uncharacterized protein YuzE